MNKNELNSDLEEEPDLPDHFYSNQEIEALISTDFCSKIDQNIRKSKDNLIGKVKDLIVDYIYSQNERHKKHTNSNDNHSISQEQSYHSISHQEEEQRFTEEEEHYNEEGQHYNEEEQRFIEEEEQQNFEEEEIDDDNTIPINNSQINYQEEEEDIQNDFNYNSDKIPSGLLNSFGEEEDRINFEFEQNSQIPHNFPVEDLSQIEKEKHHTSAASGSQIMSDGELQSVEFISRNDDELNLSPVGNKNDEELSFPHVSDNNEDLSLPQVSDNNEDLSLPHVSSNNGDLDNHPIDGNIDDELNLSPIEDNRKDGNQVSDGNQEQNDHSEVSNNNEFNDFEIDDIMDEFGE